jgi:C-terminal processing protease CtpA/Prc
MRHLLSVISIYLISLPATASAINDNPLTRYENDISQTRVNLNSRPSPFQFQANHGIAPVGVVGVKIDSNLNGGIIAEYPPSNLWKFGIVPGDQILAVEGRPVNYYTFEDDCTGVPGQLRNLTIVHNGQVTNIAVPLVAVDKVLSYNRNYQRSASMAVRW